MKLDNGLFAWLVDMGNTGEVAGFGCCEFHRLLDYWPDTGTYVVALNRDEIGSTLLISERTADVVSVTGTPSRNPVNGKLFVSLMASDMEGYSLQVWDLAQDGWKQSFDCQLTYGTDQIRWIGPQSAELSESEHPDKKFQLSSASGAWKSDACGS